MKTKYTIEKKVNRGKRKIKMKQENKQPTIEQVAQRMQVLSFNIKQMQTEYKQLHDVWVESMKKLEGEQSTEVKEDGKKKE